jgi:hypothetical protein
VGCFVLRVMFKLQVRFLRDLIVFVCHNIYVADLSSLLQLFTYLNYK